MRNFKRVIAAIILFALFSSLFAFVLLTAFFRYSDDTPSRKALAGTLDTLICGSSTAERALIPEVIDASAGTKSYNLSTVWQGLDGTKALLMQELERNPDVENVVLVLSYTTFADLVGGSVYVRNLYTLSRLGNYPDRLEYIKGRNAYAITLSGMFFGTQRIYGLWQGNDNHRGYFACKYEDVRLRASEAASKHGTELFDLAKTDANVRLFDEIITILRDRDINIACAIMPYSDAMLWKYGNWDEFEDMFMEVCESYSLPFADFNLLKNRYELFSDKSSFSDEDHLSSIGADVFSPVFAEIMPRLLAGEDISEYFYTDYVSLLEDSPYNVKG